MAISVDPPAASEHLAGSLGLTFPILSDPGHGVIDGFGVFDHENEIAWPAMFTIERDRKISWRWLGDDYKIRPTTIEVLAVLDALH